MRRFALGLSLAAAFAGAAAAATAPEWRRAREVEIRLDSFSIDPRTIRLEAGRPARLLLVNESGQTHDFSSRAFFSAAAVRPRDAARAAGGRIVVRPGERVAVLLVPVPGRYKVRSDNVVHRILGMTGEIVVE